MINSPFDLLYLLYIALTESLFVQIFFIIVIQISKWYIDNPKENWYYD